MFVASSAAKAENDMDVSGGTPHPPLEAVPPLLGQDCQALFALADDPMPVAARMARPSTSKT
jgi:hypothetical protein